MKEPKLKEPTFRFCPTKFTWVAIHPKPVGIVYFIGGAFFGSFPTLFYRFLLKSLFHKGYTVVALPFRFSFRHWSVALSLLENQDNIRQEIEEEARKWGFETALYTRSPATNTLTDAPAIKEYWVGHSLGCKYVALMELLTDFEIFDKHSAMLPCIGQSQSERIDGLIDGSSLETVSLYNQPSILLDPVVSDLDNAIPTRSLRLFFNRLVQVLPARAETFCLIENSHLFALTSIISFDSKVARESVSELKQILDQRLLNFRTTSSKGSWLGRHLMALGVGSSRFSLVEAVLNELDRASRRWT